MVLAPLLQSDLCGGKDARMSDVDAFPPALRCLPSPTSPSLSLQAHVQDSQLPQKARVGTDVSVGPHGSHGLPQCQALSNHQEGQH